MLEEALEWIARWTDPPSDIIISLFKGRYGEVLLKVVQDAYFSSETDLLYLGANLSYIHLHQIGWMGIEALHSQFFEKIAHLLRSKTAIQKAIGALIVIVIAFSFCNRRGDTEITVDSKKRLKALGDQVVPILYSEVPSLHFAACWAFSWLGTIAAWSPDYKPDILARLFELLKNSQLPDVKHVASWALSELPIIDRELKPMPKPDPASINFIKEQYSDEFPPIKLAALVIAFYWKKPWTDKELAERVEGVKIEKIGWKRNKELILKALKSQKDAHSA